ncbi:hypothetical protein [Ensifer sp. SSB1]|uniref:hypothetical protein n=1 Tax=Ensifer sp. SSB1 TaxID=2795385 RepID=UPI001A4CE736|nr:hypothetical protein [Ensifer sp. SSB1]MBK5567610.1 hypothetical protein [Ensifer sp. SSB1]
MLPFKKLKNQTAKPLGKSGQRLQDSAAEAAVNAGLRSKVRFTPEAAVQSLRASSSRQQIRFYYNCVMMAFRHCPDTREQGYSAQSERTAGRAALGRVFCLIWRLECGFGNSLR